MLTHGLLVALSLMIVFINLVAYVGMDNDAVIINQSGKLRALSYNMSQITNRMDRQDSQSNMDELHENLRIRMNEFDSILLTLSEKSKTGINHNETIVKMENLTKEWNEVYKPLYLKILNNDESSNICVQINSDIDLFVNDINEMVSLYSIYAREKVFKALTINAALIIVIIIVTLYSFASTNKRIRKPMNILMQELKELSLIDDEVSRRLKNINTDEISEMTHYFNEMMYDQLTNAFNRRSGLAKLSRLLQYDNRRQMQMSLCFIDINGLKEVNDQLGHKYGDELIVSAVEAILLEIRENDFIIRMGGDEFLIVFSGIDSELSEKVWDRIKRRYQVINDEGNRAYIISVSHGIVEYNNYEKSEVELLIKNADDKMYKEKKYIKEELKLNVIKINK